MLAQGLKKLQQRVAANPRFLTAAACTDQVGELLGGQAQFVGFDPEKIADSLEVVGRRPALSVEVFIELGPVDRELAAYLGNRAVMTAQQLEIEP